MPRAQNATARDGRGVLGGSGVADAAGVGNVLLHLMHDAALSETINLSPQVGQWRSVMVIWWFGLVAVCERAKGPNDLKLRDSGVRHGSCMAGGKAAAEAATVGAVGYL